MSRETTIAAIYETVNEMTDEKVQGLYAFITACSKNEDVAPAATPEKVVEVGTTERAWMQKDEYIKGINKEMEKCNDVELLDLFYQLLMKSNKNN